MKRVTSLKFTDAMRISCALLVCQIVGNTTVEETNWYQYSLSIWCILKAHLPNYSTEICEGQTSTQVALEAIPCSVTLLTKPSAEKTSLEQAHS